MAITGWRGISDLCLALSVDAPPRATVMNLTITARDTSLERGTRTTEGQMPVFMKYDGVDGQFNGADAYDFSQLMSEPTAPAGEVNHSEFAIVKRLDSTAPTVDYVFGVEVPKLTSEPTAPEAGGGPKDWIIVESYQFADNAGADGKGYVLTSIQHSATDTTLVDQSGTEASSRLFVGNLTLDSQASVQTGFGGGVSVASGDVNGDTNAIEQTITLFFGDGSPTTSAHAAISLGDGKAIEAAGDDYGIGEWSDPAQPDANPDTLDCSELTQWASSTGAPDATGDAADFVAWQKAEALGDPITFTYTVTNTSPAYDDPQLTAIQARTGLLLPAVQDDGLLLPAVLQTSAGGEDSWGLWQINVEPNQYNPDTFANDLHDSPTRPAVAMETLTIAHEGYWLI